MDQEDSVQTGTPKERIGVSEKEVASPAVGTEPAFDLARSDGGSRAAGMDIDATPESVTGTSTGILERHGHSNILSQVVIRVMTYGRLITRKDGRIGGEVEVRLRRGAVERQIGLKLEDWNLYRLTGHMEEVFSFEVYYLPVGLRTIVVHFPNQYVERIKPQEAHSVTLSSIMRVKTAEQLDRIIRESGLVKQLGDVHSWRKIAMLAQVEDTDGVMVWEGTPGPAAIRRTDLDSDVRKERDSAWRIPKPNCPRDCKLCGVPYQPNSNYQKYCSSCRKVKIRDWMNGSIRKRIEYYRGQRRKAAIRIRQNQKLKVLNYYSNGTLVCACCREQEYEFLTVDHINNNGAEERRTIRSQGDGSAFYYWLVKNGFPKGYQVLCMNCNMSKGHHGVCVHQRGVEARFHGVHQKGRNRLTRRTKVERNDESYE